MAVNQSTYHTTLSNSITESVRTDLAAIGAEQQYLKSQNGKLQETIGS
jgi:hypothetical protein